MSCKKFNIAQSAHYIVLYCIFKQMDPSVHHMSLVISPLRSLMHDQVKIWSKRNVRCVAVMGDMSEADKQGSLLNTFQDIYVYTILICNSNTIILYIIIS